MTLDIIIKSRNVLDRLHWAVKRKLKQEYALLIRNKMRTKPHYKELITEPTFFKHEIVSYRKRYLDFDNLYHFLHTNSILEVPPVNINILC